MKFLRRVRTWIKQWRINREVSKGQVLYDQLIAEGYSVEEIRGWWLFNCGVKPGDWPHDHDEGA